MFTAKFYGLNGRTKIHEADSFTIIKFDDVHEVTLHRANVDGFRIDLSDDEPPNDYPLDQYYQRLVIENANGKTTEMITTPKAMGQPF